jgi:GNAT superfamily N-acetyltransferase
MGRTRGNVPADYGTGTSGQLPGEAWLATIVIRRKHHVDANACLELARLTHEVDGYPKYLPDDLDAFVNNPAEMAAWVAESACRLVGHVAVHGATGDPASPVASSETGLAAEEMLVIARLMVHPKARRKGVGRQLLDAATSYAATRQRMPVLDVLQESSAAIALYEDLGWRCAGPLVLPLHGHPALQLWVYVGPSRRKPQGATAPLVRGQVVNNNRNFAPSDVVCDHFRG